MTNPRTTQVIRNVPNFIRSYISGKSGQQALARKPYHSREGAVWQSPAMAIAFKEAVNA